MARLTSKKGEIELHSDAMARFERAVAVVVKSPPQHRKAKAKTKKRKSSAKRALKSPAK